MKRITENQLSALDTLECVRLSSTEGHLRDVEYFDNGRNDSLASTLKNEAFQDDDAGKVAYFLIKDNAGNILFYFSLKCGVLYDKHVSLQNIKKLRRLYSKLEEIRSNLPDGDEDKELLSQVVEDIRRQKGITKINLDKLAMKNPSLTDYDSLFKGGVDKVGRTFAGIELVQFCVNDNHRQTIAEYGFPQKFGAVMFWRFVSPTVRKAMEFVGCEYLFLFAADNSEDGDLVNYYKDMLGFKEPEEVNVSVPLYDLACTFLYQEAALLEEKQQAFFDNFNHDNDAV